MPTRLLLVPASRYAALHVCCVDQLIKLMGQEYLPAIIRYLPRFANELVDEESDALTTCLFACRNELIIQMLDIKVSQSGIHNVPTYICRVSCLSQ